MTVILTRRADINLDSFRRVAWQGEGVRLSDTALQVIAACRRSFLQLIDKDPDLVIYGVTTATGELASRRLRAEERDRHARLKPFAAATSFGDPLPDRVVRGIVLARLANFIEGNAATTPRIADAVAAMLEGGPMPPVPGAGQGGAGEILALYPLFAGLSTRFDLEVKERGSLINGSPCAAALVADAALAARRRLDAAHKVFALSIEAFRAPLEHYDAALESLWGDEHEAAALRGLRGFLAGAGGGRRNFQAPVSYRILPRVLGHAHRATAAAERAATLSLRSVSDNPVYVPPDDEHPWGRCLSTGGYHNAMAAPALDDLAGIWADICLLCDRHSSKLLIGRVSLLPDLLMVGREASDADGHGNIGYVQGGNAQNRKTLVKSMAKLRRYLPESRFAGGNAGGTRKHARNIPEVPADYPAVPAANNRVRNFVEGEAYDRSRHMMEAWASRGDGGAPIRRACLTLRKYTAYCREVTEVGVGPENTTQKMASPGEGPIRGGFRDISMT